MFRARFLMLALLLCLLPVPVIFAGAVDTPAALSTHVVTSQKLRDIMGRMNALLYEREQTALELELIRSRYLQTLVTAVEDLALQSDDLAGLLGNSRLDAKDQERFRVLVDELHTRVVRLQLAAESGDYSALNDAYHRVVETCSGCHAIFRGR